MQNQSNSKLALSLIAVLVVAGGIFGYAYSQKSINVVADTSSDVENSAPKETVNPETITREDDGDEDYDDDDAPVKPMPQITEVPPADSKTAKYKDGTYSAIGTYNSPGGLDRIGVTITLKNNIVTALVLKNMAGDRTSSIFEDMFIAGAQSVVVGKNINDLKLTVVSGSSLTPKGFNDAVAQIKLQAKA